MFWEDGESGILEFTSATDPHFDEITDLITDGIDDSLIVFWRWTIGSGFGGNGALESEMFGLDTDLMGNDIELIRLTVHDVSIEPFGPDRISVRTNITYDFFGTPVPEPGVAVLLISGVIYKLTERRIR